MHALTRPHYCSWGAFSPHSLTKDRKPASSCALQLIGAFQFLFGDWVSLKPRLALNSGALPALGESHTAQVQPPLLNCYSTCCQCPPWGGASVRSPMKDLSPSAPPSLAVLWPSHPALTMSQGPTVPSGCSILPDVGSGAFGSSPDGGPIFAVIHTDPDPVSCPWRPVHRGRLRIDGRVQTGSHCILLENIDIYFSSQLELNTILPGLKKKKTKQKQNKKTKQKTKPKHSAKSTASRLPALTLSSWLGLPICPVPPSLKAGAKGWRRVSSWAGPSKSNVIALGGQRTEKGKEPRLDCPR